MKTEEEMRQAIHVINQDNNYCHLAHIVLEDWNLDKNSIVYVIRNMPRFIKDSLNDLEREYGDDAWVYLQQFTQMGSQVKDIFEFLLDLLNYDDAFLERVFELEYPEYAEENT